jgi:hypothetical protein
MHADGHLFCGAQFKPSHAPLPRIAANNASAAAGSTWSALGDLPDSPGLIYEDNQTPEAHLAHDADKIEMLIQAIEYQALGADTSQWQDSALAALRTDAGAELARAVTSSSPQWWAAFNASYSELRASTRAHKQLRKPAE